MDEYIKFVDWVLENFEGRSQIDPIAVSAWLRPHFQNYSTDDGYFINPNGVALRELGQFLTNRNVDKFPSDLEPGSTRSILLVSYYAPSLTHAGGLRVLDLYREIRKINPTVKLSLYAPSHPEIDGDTSTLSEIFDVIHFTTPERFSFADFILHFGTEADFDVVDAQFHQAGKLLHGFRSPQTRTLFTPMECLSRMVYDRLLGEFESGEGMRLGRVFETILSTRDELKTVQGADLTVCVSSADAKFLGSISGATPVDYFPTGVSEVEFKEQLTDDYIVIPPSARSKSLVFSAYYGSETNVAGLKWFIEKVHPTIKSVCPDYRLKVVGRGDLSWLEHSSASNIDIVGEVPLLGPVLEQCRAGLVLALFGSGFRGKINQYSVCGLPSISTPLGLTGLEYVNAKDIIVATEPNEFALQCIRILEDGAHADRIGEAARATALEKYVWATNAAKLRSIYGV